jgi:hypothetical protein
MSFKNKTKPSHSISNGASMWNITSLGKYINPSITILNLSKTNSTRSNKH